MKRVKKSLMIFIVIAMVMVLFASCKSNTGADNEETPMATEKAEQETDKDETTAPEQPEGYVIDSKINELGSIPAFNETIEFVVGIQGDALIEDFETNLQTLKIEEYANCDLSFIVLPVDRTERYQKVDLMFAASDDDLPDIFIGDVGEMASISNYGAMGKIIDLTEYYENLAYYISIQNAKLAIDPLPYMKSPDGNFYALYRIMESMNNQVSGGRMMIYEPWLEALGLDMPTTTAEFKDVLTAFKDNDPNGNGEADEIPLLSYKDYISTNHIYYMFAPFVYVQPNYWIVENGKIDVAFTQDGWKEAIKYNKELIDLQLFDPVSFTQDKAQFNTLVNNEETIVGAYARISSSNISASDIRRTEYVLVPPLEGPDGTINQWYNPSLPYPTMVITSKCENPQAAFVLGDLMCMEELSLWTRWGQKGVDYAEPEAGEVSWYYNSGFEPMLKETSGVWGGLQNVLWRQIGPHIVDARYPVGIVATKEEGVYSHYEQIGTGIITQLDAVKPEQTVAGLLYTQEEQMVIQEFHATIMDYVKEYLAAFMTGTKDIDQDWEDYLAEFEKMNLDEVIRVTQQAYDRQQD